LMTLTSTLIESASFWITELFGAELLSGGSGNVETLW
jgi:hypothetical protein